VKAPICDSEVTLNADGKRYSASFRVDCGVMTVTSGTVSKAIRVDGAPDPKSIARTVLRMMVRDSRATDHLSELNTRIQEPGPKRRRANEHFSPLYLLVFGAPPAGATPAIPGHDVRREDRR